ncbi:imelysin family protein [Pikeienuella sp. HZG-20]|uniref:imelysin family protein n=1 Tax=Paludibacillus litoralis TaxID=3133267 RepID=UPI0030EB2A6E
MKTITLAFAASFTLGGAAMAAGADKADVIATYADIGHAGYEDSLITARRLGAAVDALLGAPSAETLAAAKAAWLAARVPYQQTEAFRFGNPIVDAWEGKVNAWPLDEGLIDYVDASYGGATDENPAAALNVIASPTLTLSGRTIDAAEITPELLSETLHEADEIEANVATGYHAIEFLLWGQDLNGTGPGAGERPWTDYAIGDACTNDNCARRGAYLKAATELLISDLEWMTAAWAEGGEARAEVSADVDAGVAAILTGMGSLSYGEQAGERMRLGLMLNDPEEEHDCFSDNTHNSHFYDGLGIRNVYTGAYVRIDGRIVSGPSVSDLVAEAAPDVDAALRLDLDRTMAALSAIKTVAEAGKAYDQMLAPGDAEGEALIMRAVDALIAQTRGIERAVGALNLSPIAFEGSDSLDAPDAVFQ